jgi:hypothetical protein
LTWETIYGEDGTMKTVFLTPPDPSLMPYPIAVYFFNVETAIDFDYHEDGNGFPRGLSVVFRPPAAF